MLWTDASQLVKTVAAAVLAWLVARHVLGAQQPFLAPWAALLTVHATVYRTLARGAQQVGATILGVLLAFAAGSLLGVNGASLTVVLLAGMVAGATRSLRAESTTAAATGLVVLLTGSSGDSSLLAGRLVDTVIGIGIGLLINLLVWPPLRDRSAARRIDMVDDRLGALLTDIAARLRDGGREDDADEWIERTRDVEHDIDDAWATVRSARESGRLNPRRSAAARVQAAAGFADALTRLEQALAEVRSLVRTIGGSTGALGDWDPRFRDRWVDLLRRTGAAIRSSDVAEVERLREAVEAAAGELGGMRASQGALLVNLRNILDAMSGVASTQPARAHTAELPALPRRWRRSPELDEGGRASSIR